MDKRFSSGLSLSPCAYCLDNWMTCCQRGLCECALAVGQSDPLACLTERENWCPWYAISSRNVQTVWTARQAWLAVALLKVCRRNYLLGSWPGGFILKEPVVIYLFVHLNLMHAATFKNLQVFNTDFQVLTTFAWERELQSVPFYSSIPKRTWIKYWLGTFKCIICCRIRSFF